jgi:hypothetical protein
VQRVCVTCVGQQCCQGSPWRRVAGAGVCAGPGQPQPPAVEGAGAGCGHVGGCTVLTVCWLTRSGGQLRCSTCAGAACLWRPLTCTTEIPYSGPPPWLLVNAWLWVQEVTSLAPAPIRKWFALRHARFTPYPTKAYCVALDGTHGPGACWWAVLQLRRTQDLGLGGWGRSCSCSTLGRAHHDPAVLLVASSPCHLGLRASRHRASLWPATWRALLLLRYGGWWLGPPPPGHVGPHTLLPWGDGLSRRLGQVCSCVALLVRGRCKPACVSLPLVWCTCASCVLLPV